MMAYTEKREKLKIAEKRWSCRHPRRGSDAVPATETKHQYDDKTEDENREEKKIQGGRQQAVGILL